MEPFNFPIRGRSWQARLRRFSLFSLLVFSTLGPVL